MNDDEKLAVLAKLAKLEGEEAGLMHQWERLVLVRDEAQAALSGINERKVAIGSERVALLRTMRGGA
jgi:hypothetical protein